MANKWRNSGNSERLFSWAPKSLQIVTAAMKLKDTYSFPNLEPVFCSCPVLTIASWPTYRFLRRQVRWSGIPISLRIFLFVVIHTVKGFGIITKAEVDVFLELSCFFNDPMDVSNLISGSSAFSKSSLLEIQFMYYWSLAWRILSITLLVCEMSAIVW